MIIINPSDIIETPELKLLNNNSYGNVSTTLHKVYESEDNKVDLSITLDLSSLWDSDDTTFDNITFSNLSNTNISGEIRDGDDLVAKIYDLRTYIGGKSVDNINNINSKYIENVYKQLRIEIFKDFVDIQKINQIQARYNLEHQYFTWEGGVVFEQFKDVVNKNAYSSNPTSTVVDNFLQLEYKTPTITRDQREVPINYTISETEETFVIEVDVSVQEISTDHKWYFAKKIEAGRHCRQVINLDFYSVALENDVDPDKTTAVFDESLSTFDLPNNELTQKGAKYNNYDLFEANATDIIRNYKNGRQTIRLRCKVKEYADEKEYLQIDPKNGETFEIGDIVCPYVSKGGYSVPLSIYADGTARTFKVSKSELVYDKGKVYTEIEAKESVPFILSINTNTAKVYRNGSLLQNGDFIYEGDTLNIYSGNEYLVASNKVISPNSSDNIYVTSSVFVEVINGLIDFETMSVIYTWNELIERGYLVSDGTGIESFNSNLQGTLYIPATIDSIYGEAFANSNVTRVNIPSSVTYIGDYAFTGCNNLQSVVISGVVSEFGNEIFSGCSNLKVVDMSSEGITRVQYGMFLNCTSLTDIYLPYSVRVIDDYAFSGCTSLTNVNEIMRRNLTRIGSYAFSGCGITGELDIYSPALTTIGEYAFENCTGITACYMPEGSLTRIDEGAFYNCSNILNYYATGWSTVPTLSASNVFYNINSNCKFYVSSSIYNQIISAPNWSTYQSYIVST